MFNYPYAMFHGNDVTISGGPTVVASDNFNRADNASLGSNWDVGGDASFRIASNVVAMSTSATGYTFAVWNANPINNNQYSQIKVTATQNDFYCGATCRATIDGDSYSILTSVNSSNGTEFAKTVGGIYSVLSTTSIQVVAGDVIKIQANGTAISWYINDSLQESVTDGSLLSGSCGFNTYYGTTNGTMTLDDFECGNL